MVLRELATRMFLRHTLCDVEGESQREEVAMVVVLRLFLVPVDRDLSEGANPLVSSMLGPDGPQCCRGQLTRLEQSHSSLTLHYSWFALHLLGQR